MAEYSLNETIKGYMSGWLERFGKSVAAQSSSQCIRDVINDDAFWEDELGSSALRNVKELSTAASATEADLVLAVTVGTWNRYPAFPGTAVTTLENVYPTGVCLNLAQLLLVQLITLIDLNIHELLGTSEQVTNEQCMVDKRADGKQVAGKQVAGKQVGEQIGEQAASLYQRVLSSAEHRNLLRCAVFTKLGLDPEPSLLRGRVVLLPPEIDIWRKLSEALGSGLEGATGGHFLWTETRHLLMEQVVPVVRVLGVAERQRRLRRWCLRARESFTGFEGEPIYIVRDPPGPEWDGREPNRFGPEGPGLKVNLTHYCSTQQLRHRQDQYGEVAQILDKGDGLLWTSCEPLVAKVVTLIVDTVSAALLNHAETGHGHTAEPLTPLEMDLLVTLRTEVGLEEPRTTAGPTGWNNNMYCSQLGLKPIDVELSEQLENVMNEGTQRFLSEEFQLTEELLRKYPEGHFWQRR
ncbi:hypothetical protein GNI_041510 [Gregarina niphandrodes]|uniref:Uncharacterized protein n=1 Tax=Gregarina niphandrodes TaxID=110365 RepID=A0A023BA49_GRENI|nr:hypothetical protein GNI_041510 [Gregarina niphandrodes]EZG77881.1 hypothetical protein GNI_041510 [Gregarina niphandrodes]|eukprot:XP_011129481.1 hypothetical protein GNI_041510 [Gregarina niphandrodes]